MDTPPSSLSWLSELDMEAHISFNQFRMDSLDDFATQSVAAAIGDHQDLQQQYSLSSDGDSSAYTNIPTSACDASTAEVVLDTLCNCESRPRQQRKLNTTNDPDSSFPGLILSFGNINSDLVKNPQQSPGDAQGSMSGELRFLSDVLLSQGSSCETQENAAKGSQGSTRTAAKPPSHSRDHIMAERMRRERLNQQFIALSAIVPDLKKVDKTSVLGGAIRYMKQLQEQVKALEEQTAKKAAESVVAVKKSQVLVEDDDSSSNENFAGGSSDEKLPEIEARVSGKNALLRIHCEKQKGVLVKILSQIETLGLCVINASVTPFGDTVLDITIIAEMEDICMAPQDLVEALSEAFRKFM